MLKKALVVGMFSSFLFSGLSMADTINYSPTGCVAESSSDKVDYVNGIARASEVGGRYAKLYCPVNINNSADIESAIIKVRNDLGMGNIGCYFQITSGSLSSLGDPGLASNDGGVQSISISTDGMLLKTGDSVFIACELEERSGGVVSYQVTDSN